MTTQLTADQRISCPICSHGHMDYNDEACVSCGCDPTGHRVAVANGGSDEMDNLIAACADCNLGKGARLTS